MSWQYLGMWEKTWEQAKDRIQRAASCDGVMATTSQRLFGEVTSSWHSPSVHTTAWKIWGVMLFMAGHRISQDCVGTEWGLERRERHSMCLSCVCLLCTVCTITCMSHMLVFVCFPQGCYKEKSKTSEYGQGEIPVGGWDTWQLIHLSQMKATHD